MTSCAQIPKQQTRKISSLNGPGAQDKMSYEQIFYHLEMSKAELRVVKDLGGDLYLNQLNDEQYNEFIEKVISLRKISSGLKEDVNDWYVNLPRERQREVNQSIGK
tara:strand:- start:5745 stop:6062 length:318 start_codon:yes stop_codon:yes gene_type:complete